MDKIDYTTGPYGKYDRKSTGHILNTLCHMGIPLTTVEQCQVGGTIIFVDKASYASYKYFDGIEQPLFRFVKPDYYPGLIFSGSSKDGQVTTTPEFRLSLSVNGAPGIIVSGDIATEEVYKAIQRSLTNWTPDPAYDIHKEAGAFFQGGHGNPTGNWFFVELWKPAGAQLYADHLSKIYADILKENTTGVKIGNTPFAGLDKLIKSSE